MRNHFSSDFFKSHQQKSRFKMAQKLRRVTDISTNYGKLRLMRLLLAHHPTTICYNWSQSHAERTTTKKRCNDDNK
jgi:hypothetical protein